MIGALVAPAALRAQSPAALLEQGIRAYSEREYDGGAWLLRRALAAEGAGALSPAETSRALMYLTATEVARDQRDSAVAAARRLLVLDPRFRPDEQTFPPQVLSLFQEARHSSPAVSIRAQGDTAIRPGTDAFVVRLGASSAPDVIANVMGTDGRVIRRLYSGTIRDSVDLRWNGLDDAGAAAAAGRYSIVVTPTASSRDRRAATTPTNWTLRLPLEVARQAVDTTPLPPAPPDSLFRPERGDMSGAMHALVPGVIAGVAIVALPKLVAGGDHASGARWIVAGTVTIAGVAAFLSHHPGQRLAGNAQYNRNLRESWRHNVAEISRRNADRMRQARMIIRPGAPSLVTAGDTP
jgi:hypothetical protein